MYLQWTAPRKPAHQRGKGWYVGTGIAAAILLAYALLTQTWTFAVVLVLLAVVYGLVHNKPHPPMSITLTESGVQWGTKFIPWKDVSGYWMLQGPDFVELNIERKNGMERRITILTGTEDPHLIHAMLSQCIPHFQDRGENLLDAILRLCKL